MLDAIRLWSPVPRQPQNSCPPTRARIGLGFVLAKIPFVLENDELSLWETLVWFNYWLQRISSTSPSAPSAMTAGYFLHIISRNSRVHPIPQCSIPLGKGPFSHLPWGLLGNASIHAHSSLLQHEPRHPTELKANAIPAPGGGNLPSQVGSFQLPSISHHTSEQAVICRQVSAPICLS